MLHKCVCDSNTRSHSRPCPAAASSHSCAQLVRSAGLPKALLWDQHGIKGSPQWQLKVVHRSSQRGCALPGRVLPIHCSLALYSLLVALAHPLFYFCCISVLMFLDPDPVLNECSTSCPLELADVWWCPVLCAGMWLSCSLSSGAISAVDSPLTLSSLSDVSSNTVLRDIIAQSFDITMHTCCYCSGKGIPGFCCWFHISALRLSPSKVSFVLILPTYL